MRFFSILLFCCLLAIACSSVKIASTNHKSMKKWLDPLVGEHVNKLIFLIGKPTKKWNIEDVLVLEYQSAEVRSYVEGKDKATYSFTGADEFGNTQTSRDEKREVGCALRFAINEDKEVINYSYSGMSCSPQMVFQ